MAVPVPCRHCGFNYMKGIEDKQGLCNNCTLADERRNPKKGENKVESIEILVKCPRDAYAKLEEHCINEGKDLSTFIMYCALEKLEIAPKVQKTSLEKQVEEAREISESEEPPKRKAKK